MEETNNNNKIPIAGEEVLSKINPTLPLAISIVILIIIGAYSFAENFKKINPFGEEYRINKKRLEVSSKIEAGNISSCNEIQDEIYRNICLDNYNYNTAKSTSDLTYCDKLTGQIISNESCTVEILVNSALKNSDINNCNNSRIDSAVKYCKDNYYKLQSVSMNDIKICQKLATKQLISDCELYFNEHNK